MTDGTTAETSTKMRTLLVLNVVNYNKLLIPEIQWEIKNSQAKKKKKEECLKIFGVF